MEVKTGKENIPVRQEITHFIHSSRKVARIRVDDFCMESHVSTRTYYKIMKYKMVKHECYCRLFIGLCRIADDKMFDKHWTEFGQNLYRAYHEE